MDKQYPLKNFKTVKKGRDTHILGFDKNGRVFLTQNIKDQKYYSVKEISKEKLMENNDERFIRNELKILPKQFLKELRDCQVQAIKLAF